MKPEAGALDPLPTVTPVPVAHLCGAFAGLLICMVPLSRQPSKGLPGFGLPSR